MSTYSGIVTKVANNPWQDKVLYSFQIDSENYRWFRTGEDPTGLAVGEAIQFEQEGNDKVDPKAIKRISADEITKTEPAAAKAYAPKTTAASRNNYWEEKQVFEREMQPVWDWGRARSDAARVVQAAFTTGALEFPASANKSKRLALIVATLHEVTKELIDKEKEIKGA